MALLDTLAKMSERFEELERELAPEVESLKRYKKNEFNDDPYWVDRVYEELKPAFDRFGYEKPQVGGADPNGSKSAIQPEPEPSTST